MKLLRNYPHVPKRKTAAISKSATDMTFLGHLQELRKRLFLSAIGILIGSVIAFLFFNQLLDFLFAPFLSIETMDTEKQLFINTLFEGFLTKIKISLLTGAILSFPLHLYNIIKFVFPALSKKEKGVILIGLITSTSLIIGSFYYSYYKIIPLSVKFLTSRAFIPFSVGLLLNYNKNIFYILQFIFIALILFQTPIILELLLITNIVKRTSLLRASKYIVVMIFVFSSLLTPPDFISQVSLAGPLIALFFLTLLIAKIFRFGEG